MKIRIHGKNLSKKFRFGVLGMTELSLLDLLDNSKVCKNLEVDVHFRHYSDIGEAIVHEDEFRRYPRRFRVIIDPYRLEVDDYDRKRNDEEVVSEMFRVLGHELVHVKQYVVGDLAIKAKGLYWKGVKTDVNSLKDYFKSPWEIEAYGLEQYLLKNFLEFWTNNVEDIYED